MVLHWANITRRSADALVRLAEAVGAVHLRNPEAAWLNVRDISVEAIFKLLDEKLGFGVDFPNPYPGEFGLKTSRGTIDHRALQAVYQAWRLSTFADKSDTRILEIGAGVGRTAYYARKLGLLDYTIVDIPLVNAAQANFLGRVIDPSLLVLSNEDDDASRHDKVRIFGPRWFLNSPERFDIAFNADSITEVDCNQAVDYFRKIARHAGVFVSINHEVNSFRAGDLPTLAGIPMHFSRYPYWLRDGYVEEVFFFHEHRQTEPDLRVEVDRFARIVLDQQIQMSRQANLLQSRRALVRHLIKMTIGTARARRGWA
jgi:hypothetical protein